MNYNFDPSLVITLRAKLHRTEHYGASPMQKLQISPAVDKIIKAIGLDWLKENAKPFSTGYAETQLFFSPQRGVTYWLSAAGSAVAVERREFQGLKGCIVTDRFQCPIEKLRQAIEARIFA
jgi:hypothetical protein